MSRHETDSILKLVFFIANYCFLAPPLFGIDLGEESSSSSDDDCRKNSRTGVHLYYVLHFPFPHINKNSHDNNQRLVLLFGFGKHRQEFLKKLKDLKTDLYQYFGAKGQESIKTKENNATVIR